MQPFFIRADIIPHMLHTVLASIGHIDLWAFYTLYAMRTYSVTVFAIGISQLASPVTILGLLGICFVILVHQRRLPDALGILISVVGAYGTVAILKILIERPRPPLDMQAIIETGYSFPSGHSVAAMSMYGFLAYLLYRDTTSRTVRWLTVSVASALILLVGWSRLYLGVHYLSDVLAGFLVGAAFLYLAIIVTRHFSQLKH